MRVRKLALTGPAAAALYELDGYRDEAWPLQRCAPAQGPGGPDVIRARAWEEPSWVDDVPVAPVRVVLRQLASTPDRDGLAAADRIELAVEHALREGMVTVSELRSAGGAAPGDVVLRRILRQRGEEPATESYAETRALQLLRRGGWLPWRQVPILAGRTVRYRADFVVPFDARRRRPPVVGPDDGVVVEIDGRSVHEPQFERDHRRQTDYELLGFRWLSFTPTQVEQTPAKVLAAVERRLAHRTTRRVSPHNSGEMAI